jgi:hypothetical protein
VTLTFDLPFLKVGKLFMSPNFTLSFQPALLTWALVTILFLWLRKLCLPSKSLFLTLTEAFGTMLWPCTYISLETKQSFFVFLTGYPALADGKIERWPRLLLFAATCGLAWSLKITGIILSPVVPRAFRSHREIAIFILLVTICTVCFASILTEPGSAGWGPRYLHIIIAPLIICIGAASPTFRWRRNAILVVLSAIGINPKKACAISANAGYSL